MNEVYSIDRKWIKRDAKDAMRTHRPSIYLIALVFLAIALVLELLDTKLQFPGVSMQEMYKAANDDAAMEQMLYHAMANRTMLGSFLSLAISVMSLMISGGFVLSCLCVARRSEANVGTLFEMCGWFFRFLWLCVLMSIFIFLWSLLLIVPGIIAAYRYSMAIFIFCDDPEKGALTCIRESKAMTMGYKGQLFVLDLSFIGWYLLCIIPFVEIFVAPYVLTTRANFYRALRGEFGGSQQNDEGWQQ